MINMISNSLRSRIISLALIAGLSAATLTGCSSSQAESVSTVSSTTQTSIAVDFDNDDTNSNWDAAQACNITFAGSTIKCTGQGAWVQGSNVTIQSAGTYVISGTLDDGQIIVDSEDKQIVRLILNGTSISCHDNAPIFIKNAEKTVLTLAEGTQNTIIDGSVYILEDSASDEPNAAVFSKDDLSINGGGSLTIDANYQHGIVSKDELKIASGNIIIDSSGDGLKGKDFIAVKNGSITLNAGSDGLQSSNDEDLSKGFVYIEGGALKITALKDGIQAESSVLIKGGEIIISSGGGSVNGTSQRNGAFPGMDKNNSSTSATESESLKGIKALQNITIENGSLILDTADDAIHSNGSIIIGGGTLTISSGDDGVHADTSLVFNAGEITINKSYEALESASISINGGSVHAVAGDDGINTSGGNDGSSINGRPGQNSFVASDGSQLIINGGYIYVDSGGDGIDVNGEFTMNDGTVIINGPVNDGNGALDYNGSFNINGGFLVAAGSAGMAEAPSSSSSQASLKLNLGSQAAGTLISIQGPGGENLLTFAPAKAFATVVFSSPELEQGSSCSIYSDGSSDGSEKDGLYIGGTYTPGNQIASVQISGTVSSYGQSDRNIPGGPGGRIR